LGRGPYKRRRLRGYLALARISNSPTVASNVLAAAALAGALLPDLTVALLAVAMVAFYTAGMFLNDVCDYAVDLRERPERPLPSGDVSRPAALAGVAVLFGAGGAILLYLGRAAFLCGLVLILLIVVYDVWHKTNPLSPLLMAAARLMVYATAFFAYQPRPSLELLVSCGLLGLYVVGLTYIARSEARPDFTGYWPLWALCPPVIYFALWVPLAFLPLVILFAGWIAYSASFVYRTKGRSIGGAVGRLIAGISLYDALVLAAAGAPVGVALALLAFGTTLILQRYVKGT